MTGPSFRHTGGWWAPTERIRACATLPGWTLRARNRAALAFAGTTGFRRGPISSKCIGAPLPGLRDACQRARSGDCAAVSRFPPAAGYGDRGVSGITEKTAWRAACRSVERGAVTVSRRLRRVFRGSTVLVGDASGSVDAITGEGLSLSFHHAVALSEALCRGRLAPYQAEHSRSRGDRLSWPPCCWLLRPFCFAAAQRFSNDGPGFPNLSEASGPVRRFGGTAYSILIVSLRLPYVSAPTLS